MEIEKISTVMVEKVAITSVFLNRVVNVDFYLPKNVPDPSNLHLLLINDGQDMEKMQFEYIFENFSSSPNSNKPLLCAAIHCSAERKLEYGVANVPDYLGRGNKAHLYTSFILEELIPYIHITYCIAGFKEMAFAGFSLGGLSALDIAWQHSNLFKKAGVFSGSLWWRSMDQDDPLYDENTHRIIHQQIRTGDYKPGQQFFFQCGALDETKDRNNNGIIDSIDDTQDLIKELKAKGYQDTDIHYLELPDGKHDVPTWGKAMPDFLEWGWGK
jgi:enterochelin esterase-like enzyme